MFLSIDRGYTITNSNGTGEYLNRCVFICGYVKMELPLPTNRSIGKARNLAKKYSVHHMFQLMDDPKARIVYGLLKQAARYGCFNESNTPFKSNFSLFAEVKPFNIAGLHF